MTYAPEIKEYELVTQRATFFKSGDFVPVGDPVKAANVIVDLAKHSHPPVHLVLGSEAIGFLKNADENRTAEMQEWLQVSLSTDHDEATNFFDSEFGKSYLKK